MPLFRPAWCALLLFALTTPSVRADDVCGGDQERRKATAEARANIAKVEKSGKQADLFLAYQDAAHDDCLAKELIDKARAGMTKVGIELAAKAEAKGRLYTSEPVALKAGETRRANEPASAFAWLEAAGAFTDANRVMLKAVQAKAEDLRLFETAWTVDDRRPGSYDATTAAIRPYVSPPAYRRELERVAAMNADRLMKAEELDAKGISGSAADVGLAAMKSLDKLRTASAWMQYVPGGDKPAKARAEQRGDAIMKRPDPLFTQGLAQRYFEFSGSPKAKELSAQIQKKGEESQRALEKSGESVKSSITQAGDAEQKKFDKKKSDLEKELGF